MSILIGVDLGGTKIEAAALDLSGEVIDRRRTSTPTEGYDETIDAIVKLIEETEAETGQRARAVGFGTPGSLSPVTGLIRNANSTRLNGQPLDRDLAQVLGRPVRLENDANCFALAEARSGAGRGHGTVFGVILGTGVGGGIVMNGEVLLGRNRIAGEWGHNPLPAPTPEDLPGAQCYCGHRGCIETWCSGPALARDHFNRVGSEMDAELLAGFAKAGDLDAQETLDRHLDRLARALSAIVNVLDPDAIVLGGGLSNLDHLYARLPDAMRGFVFSDCFDTPVLRNQLGDSAGVIGAAWLSAPEAAG